MADLTQCWSRVRGFMREHCGVVMAEDQIYLLEARLLPVAQAHAYSDVQAYVEAACAAGASRALRAALIDAMTTHETLFFRDPPFWTAMEKLIVPRVTSGTSAQQPIRVWCAACSTGQEPYSVAMLFAESFPTLFDRLQITATDISEATLCQGSAGIYSSLEVNRGLLPDRLARHFTKAGASSFRIHERLRSRITWRPRNLIDAMRSEEAYEIVLCRNVLIYFGLEARKRVIDGLYAVLTHNGCLGVGSSEMIPGRRLATGWSTKEPMVQR